MSDQTHMPMVALTFDDGPGEYTPALLDALEELDCRATFCEIGLETQKYPESLKRTAALGHELACHSWTHPNLCELTQEQLKAELNDTVNAIREATGQMPAAARPPFGAHNAAVDAICGELGMYVLIWSADTRDWDHNDAARSFAAVKAQVHDGAVILCHDRSSSAEAVRLIVPWLREQGYRVGSVRELLEAKQAQCIPGTVLTSVIG